MYPRTAPFRSGLLDVGGGQSVYWEESGVPDGVPTLYLHGGPGGGLGKRGYITKYDPDRFRVIGIDQRGCGKSVPWATDPAHDLASNTTATLLADIEAVREELGVERWLVTGVSWGSTLALAYALEHPERVSGVVCVAVTTTSRFEVDWITEAVGALYPEAWDRFASHAEASGVGYQRGSGRLVDAYATLLSSPDPGVRSAAAQAWMAWEDWHVAIGAGGHSPGQHDQEPARAENFAALVTHYWAADGFCAPPILDRAAELDGIPIRLIHGRRDVSGPAVTPWRLARAIGSSRLVLVEDEGHGGPRMMTQWSRAVEELAAGL